MESIFRTLGAVELWSYTRQAVVTSVEERGREWVPACTRTNPQDNQPELQRMQNL